MKNDLSINKKGSVIKKVYRKIFIHFLIENIIMPVVSFAALSIKPIVLLVLKPVLAIMTFVLTLVIGFIGFMSKSIAIEVGDVASSEIVEESGSNILEVVLDFIL